MAQQSAKDQRHTAFAELWDTLSKLVTQFEACGKQIFAVALEKEPDHPVHIWTCGTRDSSLWLQKNLNVIGMYASYIGTVESRKCMGDKKTAVNSARHGIHVVPVAPGNHSNPCIPAQTLTSKATAHTDTKLEKTADGRKQSRVKKKKNIKLNEKESLNNNNCSVQRDSGHADDTGCDSVSFENVDCNSSQRCDDLVNINTLFDSCNNNSTSQEKIKFVEASSDDFVSPVSVKYQAYSSTSTSELDTGVSQTDDDERKKISHTQDCLEQHANNPGLYDTQSSMGRQIEQMDSESTPDIDNTEIIEKDAAFTLDSGSSILWEDEDPDTKFLRVQKAINRGNQSCLCHVCGALLGFKSIGIHMRNVHSIGVECRFMCRQCDAGFYMESKKVRHEAEMHNLSPTYYKCDVHECERQFLSKSSLDRHLEIVHKTEKFKCHTCGKTFVKNALLTNHKNMVHLKLKKLACDFCGRKFAKRSTLVMHTRRHTGEKTITCRYCDFACIQYTSLNCHMKTHHSDKLRTKE